MGKRGIKGGLGMAVLRSHELKRNSEGKKVDTRVGRNKGEKGQ